MPMPDNTLPAAAEWAVHPPESRWSRRLGWRTRPDTTVVCQPPGRAASNGLCSEPRISTDALRVPMLTLMYTEPIFLPILMPWTESTQDSLEVTTAENPVRCLVRCLSASQCNARPPKCQTPGKIHNHISERQKSA